MSKFLSDDFYWKTNQKLWITRANWNLSIFLFESIIAICYYTYSINILIYIVLVYGKNILWKNAIQLFDYFKPSVVVAVCASMSIVNFVNQNCVVLLQNTLSVVTFLRVIFIWKKNDSSSIVVSRWTYTIVHNIYSNKWYNYEMRVK